MKKVSGTNTVTVLTIDGSNPTGYSQVLEVKSSATAAPSMTYVLGADVIGQIAGAGPLQVLLYDGHGSVRGLLTAAGAVMTNGSGQQEAYDYDAFGVSLPTGLTANAAGTRLQYSGEWWDFGLQMSDNRARPYDPATGRFPIRDVYEGTIDDPQSLHRHLYTHGDPVMGIDPTGMSFSLVESQTSTSLMLGLAGLVFVGVAASSVLSQPTSAQAVANAADTLAEMLNSGIRSLADVAARVAVDQAKFAAQIGAALAAAIAAGASAGSSPPKVYPVLKSLTPTIYANTVTWLGLAPVWYVLTYDGPNPIAARARRRAAIGGLPPAGFPMSWDEFPYASTREGGARSFVASVPIHENFVQGGILGGFYVGMMRLRSGPFLVLPLPI